MEEERPAVRAFRETLVRVNAAGTLTEAEEHAVRAQVCALVDELKSAGLPPERVIVTVKRAAHEAGFASSSAHALSDPLQADGRDTFLVDLVRWCIHQYFRVDRVT